MSFVGVGATARQLPSKKQVAKVVDNTQANADAKADAAAKAKADAAASLAKSKALISAAQADAQAAAPAHANPPGVEVTPENGIAPVAADVMATPSGDIPWGWLLGAAGVVYFLRNVVK